MNIAEIGKLIGEEIAKKPEICWYPGGFKPPHKGHLAAAQQLASKPYITQVKVLIGHGERGGITAKQSKAIWDIYLKAQPNPKIVTEISQTKSPIRDLYRWFGDDLSREAYVAAAGKEADDLKYFEGLKEAFGDRVQEEIVDDQFVDSDGDRVSGTDFRATIAELRQRYLQVKNNPGDKKALNDYNTTYNYFKSLFPEAVIQKGYLDDIQRVLGINFPEPASLQEGSQPNPKNQPQWVWLEYKNQNKLNPLIFGVDETVDPEVRELLLKVANYFWEGLEIPEPFEDVLLTGSSVNYNYTPTSDIDLHIVVDFDKFDNPELLKKYFDEAKLNWNRVHDLKLGKQNIEVYIQDNEDHPEYRGEYSLMNDKWLRRPSYVNIDIPDEEIEKKTKLFKQQIDKLEKTGKDNPEKAIELTNKIKERLKNFRQAGLDKDGEYSLENLAFKDLRNTGYLEKLSNLKNSFIDKTLSLVESVDKDSLFEKFMAYACNELQIQNPPTFEVRYEYGEDQPSFGAYVPSKHHISVNPSNRNIVDVLRTLAHELVHAKQNEMGILQPDSGETGSEHENDANAIAGILMRDYGKQNPNIYNIGMLNESINKTAGVWDTNEKFKDGSDFKIKFKVSDVIDLAKNTPVKKIDPKSINYDFSGREEDPTKTKDRVNKADLTYPIIVVKNEKGKIFAMLDGTHRLEKALNLGLNKIKTKILNKEDLIQFKTDKLNEAKKINPPITRIYFDMDGVLAGFDDQFKKYNKEGYDFKEFIREYGANKAWDIINKGKEDFWAGMGWNPGGKQLYDSVVKLADEKGFEVWILSSPGLDPNGDAKRGKNKWLDKYTNIPQDRRVFKQAKDKHTEAKPGYMLIDDMGKNVSEFINAGGTGIKNNPEDSTEAIKKLYKFKYEQRNPTKKRIY
jgi:predicted nucleotidyltransferase